MKDHLGNEISVGCVLHSAHTGGKIKVDGVDNSAVRCLHVNRHTEKPEGSKVFFYLNQDQLNKAAWEVSLAKA